MKALCVFGEEQEAGTQGGAPKIPETRIERSHDPWGWIDQIPGRGKVGLPYETDGDSRCLA